MVIIVEWPELTYTHQYNKHYPLIASPVNLVLLQLGLQKFKQKLTFWQSSTIYIYSKEWHYFRTIQY
jgi:hypothetical protein